MISLHHVSKNYETLAGAFAALRDVDVQIRAGEFAGVVGKSGSGKSTLLNMIAGIDRPSSGSVTVANTTIDALSENKLAAWRGRNVGFVFQFFQLLPTLTAIEMSRANQPPLVIADEPTGNLDSITARGILDLFRELANQGTTVVIATHEADIARVSDRKIQITDGVIATDGRE